MWRPTFDVAAEMTRKTQHPSPPEDEAGTARAREWLNRWEERSTSMDPCAN